MSSSDSTLSRAVQEKTKEAESGAKDAKGSAKDAARDVKSTAKDVAHDVKGAAKDAKSNVKDAARDVNQNFPSVDEVKRDVQDLTSGKPLKDHQKKNLAKAGGALVAGILGLVVVIVGGKAIVKKAKGKSEPEEARDWFGRRKRDVENVAEDLKSKISKTGDKVGDKLGDAKQAIAGKADSAAQATRDAGEKAKKEAHAAGSKAEAKAEKGDNIVKKAASATVSGAKSAAHATKDAAGSAKESTGDFFGDVKGWFGARKAEFADSARKGKESQAGTFGKTKSGAKKAVDKITP